MSTQLDERTDLEKQTGDPEHAHIVKAEPGENAAAKAMEARVFGFAIEALCGYVFIPSKNPDNYPRCQKCQEIYDIYRSVNGLNETPNQ